MASGYVMHPAFDENKVVLYGLNWNSFPNDDRDENVGTLLDICAQHIVMDSSTTLKVIDAVPRELCYNLMRAALILKRDRSIDVLLSNWPWASLALRRLIPPVYDSAATSISSVSVKRQMHNAASYTTCLAHTFVENLKKNKNTRLIYLDMSGYPALPVLVNYLASHVSLAHNESRQCEIVKMYNEISTELEIDDTNTLSIHTTLPVHGKYMIYMDAAIRTTENHMELCKALQVSKLPNCSFSLRLHFLDVKNLGVARICVLLEVVDTQYLQGMLISSNAISNEGLVVLKPTLLPLTNLKALDISYNRLDMRNSEAIENLTDSLHTLASLQRLSMSGMYLKNSLRRLLSNVQKPLEHLSIAGCRLSPEDISYLATSDHAASVQELDIGSNSLTHCFESFNIYLQNASSTLCSLEADECGLVFEQLLHILTVHLPACVQLRFCSFSASCDTFPDVEILDAIPRVVLSPLLKALHLTLDYDQTLEHQLVVSDVDLDRFTLLLDSLIRDTCRDMNRTYMTVKIKLQTENDY